MTLRRVPFAVAVSATLALALHACGGSTPDGARPKSLVLITIDTTRADHVGAYGSTLGITPRIDALARQGVLFETAYAPMAQTLPSHSTMFTGLGPRRHGALENVYVLGDEQQTLAEICASQGLATGAFIGSLAVDHLTGIQQGFERFDEPRSPASERWDADRKGHPPQRKAHEVSAAALAWAEQLEPDRPFFLWAHYYDPHGDPGGSFDVTRRELEAVDRELVAEEVRQHEGQFRDVAGADALTDFWRGYAAEIRSMDEQIGVLLDGLEAAGRLDDTVIVVVADHGEGLYEHGQKAHGTHLWEEQVAIPFIAVAADGTAAGRRVAGLVMLEDLAPTVLTMVFGADRGLLPAGEGIDLWTPVVAGQPLPERAVVMERPHYSDERLAGLRRGQSAREFQYGIKLALRRGDHKLLLWPDERVELFDLAEDEAELVDVASAEPELTASLRAELLRWMRARPVGAPGVVVVSDEKNQSLKQLGYTGDFEDGGALDSSPADDDEAGDVKAADAASAAGADEGSDDDG